MADGIIGRAVYEISYDPNTQELNATMNGVNKTIADKANTGGKEAGDKLNSAWASKIGIISGVTSSVFSKTTSAISSSVGTAIKRVDTLKNSQKVFEALGYSASDVSDSMKELNSYLDGLPTSMTDAVAGVQSLSASFGGIKEGTQYFKAMNDAGLAFGATSSQVAGAITQLGQLSLDGPLDAQTWNSLRNNGFTPVFSAMAKEAGVTVGELKDQFSAKGTKTVQDFLNALVKMDKEGSGSMKSLSSIARENTNGIGTAIENLKNRIGKAIAETITAIGPENIANMINSFSSGLIGIGKALGEVINFLTQNQWAIAGLVGALAPLLAIDLFNKIIAIKGALTITNAQLLAVVAGCALLAGAVTFVIEHWSEITAFFGDLFAQVGEIIGNAWNGFVEGAKEAFEGIKNIFGKVAEFFGDVFSKAWNAVKKVFSVGGKIFDGIKDGIVNAFKAIVNGIIGGINKVVALPFNAINGVLDRLRDIDILGVHPFGWLGRINVPQIPKLASGGIVPSTNGGQLILAGEAGDDEWVVPESKWASLLDQLDERRGGGNITINVSGTFATSEYEQRKVAQTIANKIQEIQRQRFNLGAM